MHSTEQVLAWQHAIRIGDGDKAKRIAEHPVRIKSSKGTHGKHYTPPKKKRK
jgi:hypothetical protein